ncbi:9808_t:CDS:2, partial [Scutellospora calospora]
GDESDKKKATEWEKTRSCIRVHIDNRIYGAINNIHGSISSEAFNVKFTPKRTNQEKDNDKVRKRTRIDVYFQRTPEHQKAIEQNLIYNYSIYDHEVIIENVDNEDAYTKNIQLSYENVAEVHSIIEKIQYIECFFFKYRVVKLLVQDTSEEIESKNQRNETRQYKQRIQIGCYQDGIYTINGNATIFEIGFLEVVGSTNCVDITKLNEDTENF